ncbi:MAG TPA: serpin family protein [Elusimicrobiales bacterium]|nr:serpin family protein [Elusimicrobiales bacterium]
MKKFNVLLVSVFLFNCAICFGGSKKPQNYLSANKAQATLENSSYDTKSAYTDGVSQNTEFAVKMYSYWAEKNAGKNIFFSPYSVSSALAMVYIGASDETKLQMKNALHFSSDSGKTAQALELISNSITDKSRFLNTSISIANGLWAQQDYPFLSEYTDTIENVFSAKIESVDFVRNYEIIRQDINEWVEDKTNDKIQDLIAKGLLQPSSTLVLVNAIYFKSSWMTQFEKHLTEKNAPFYGLDNKKFKVNMMNNTDTYAFAPHEGMKILKMPYERNKFAMYVILPNKTVDISKIEKRITAKNIDKWTSSLSRVSVRVKFPKLRVEPSYELEEMFKKMGMTDAFNRKANFLNMSKRRDLFISKIIHKAFCDIDEKGTEAAAATAVIMMRATAMPQPKKSFEFTADHPFIFFIRHEESKSILFLGRFTGPKK